MAVEVNHNKNITQILAPSHLNPSYAHGVYMLYSITILLTSIAGSYLLLNNYLLTRW